MSKTPDKNFEHAEHNYSVYSHLLGLKKYNDWVATTAFYSAIYYVTFQLFPNKFEIKGKTCNCKNFDEYCKLNNFQSNKHSIREDLVYESLKDICDSFSSLREICSTARYKRYKLTEDEVAIVKESIEEIRDYCSPDPTVDDLRAAKA